MRLVLTVVFALLVAGCATARSPRADEAAAAGTRAAAAPDIEFLGRTNPNAALSPAVRVGDMLYLSGQLGFDSTGRLAEGGIEAETRQTMENIGALLTRYGSSFDHVVKCTVMLADIAEWGAMNRAYVPFFPNNRPARSALGVGGLVRNARVEIECQAVIPPRP
ncbi:MAG TPA: RidA family protein [Gemmatimonadaceae bacterium]|nr:RidA family protein [Gemmatimonadaceae bacterium]